MGYAGKMWECDGCGKIEAWGPNWRSRMVCHKTWDETIVACSEECQRSADEKRKWRKLPDKSKGEPAIEIMGGQLTPNAEVSGAGTASAGLPGYAGDNYGER
jgi:hypothetical protein